MGRDNQSILKSNGIKISRDSQKDESKSNPDMAAVMSSTSRPVNSSSQSLKSRSSIRNNGLRVPLIRQRSHTVGTRTDASRSRQAYENRFMALLNVIDSPSSASINRKRSATVSFNRIGLEDSQRDEKLLLENGVSSVTLSASSSGSLTVFGEERNTNTRTSKSSLKDRYLGFLRFSKSRSKEKIAGVRSQDGSYANLSNIHSASSSFLANVAEEGSLIVVDEIPDPLDLLDLLGDLNDFIWKSPVLSDELYLMEILFQSDQKKALEYIRGLSGLSISTEISQIPSPDRDSRFSISSSASKFSLSDSLNGNTEIPCADLEIPARRPSAVSEATIHVENTDLTNASELKEHQSERELTNAPKLNKRRNLFVIGKESRHEDHVMLKFNSCSTLLTLDSTLFKPQNNPEILDFTLKSVAYAIKSHLTRTYILFREMSRFEMHRGAPPKLSKRIFISSDVLSEKILPIWKVRSIPDEILTNPEIMQPPSLEELHQFLKQIFIAADLSAEIGIISLIYLERMLYRTKISLSGINCFRAVLGAIMIASKVWDDHAIWNTDFKTIMPDLSLKGLNRLERWWLNRIRFDVSVKRTVFAKYWFEVRELAERNWGVKPNSERSNSEGASNFMEKMQLNLYAPAIINQQESQRRKSRPDLSLIRTPKPLTEDQLTKMSAATAQSKTRESFSISLSSTLDESHPIKKDNKRKGSDSRPSKNYTASSSTVSVSNGAKQNLFFGGTNLRRTKSDQLYTPNAPPASIL